MNPKGIIGNFTVALAAQGLNMAVGVITSLLVPKVISVESFGYWQLFIFYISYVGVLHFGLCDGVYLKEGGKTPQTIDARSMNSQFWILTVSQLFFALIIATVALCGRFGQSREFVLVATAMYLVMHNLATYLGFVFQAVNHTKVYSASVVVNSVVFLVPLVIMLAANIESFEAYVVCYTAARTASLVFLAVKARDILRAQPLRANNALRASLDSIRVGIKLMIANASGLLILGVARLLVDAEWGIDVFSYVSFALSMVTFFMLFINQASMVLFPALRQSRDDEVVAFFIAARDSLDLLLPLVFMLYMPAVWLLTLWLPQYAQSLSLFALLLPLCIFDGKMNIVGTTYLKVLRGEKKLLQINLISLAASAVGCAICTYVFHSVELVLGCAVAVVAIRCLYTDALVAKMLGAGTSTLAVVPVIASAVFLTATLTIGGWAAWAITCIMVALLLAFNRKRLNEVIQTFRRVIR